MKKTKCFDAIYIQEKDFWYYPARYTVLFFGNWTVSLLRKPMELIFL